MITPRLTTLAHGGGCGCKLSPGVLTELLQRSSVLPVPPQLLVGAENSDDAAVYALSDTQAVVATTDFFTPIVDDPHDFGAIAATNALSDVYAMGARPLFALALVGMPIGQLPSEVIRRILEGGEEACARAGIPVAGGHSIDTVEPIYGIVAIGIVDPRKLKRNGGARVGDRLVLGKGLGVGIMSAALKKEALPEATYRTMLASTTKLNTPGTALSALEEVHALTDVTGFGLAGHLLEVCRGSGVGARLRWRDVPILDGVHELLVAGFKTGASGRNFASYGDRLDLGGADEATQALFTDPQTSGGLLVACAPEAVDQVLGIFAEEGFEQAAEIGEIVEGPDRVALEL